MLFMSCVYHAFASVHCCLVVTCWESLTSWFLFVMFNCVVVTFSCGILGQVWYLIVSIPDLRRLSYFVAFYINPLCTIMDSFFWFDTINFGCSIVYIYILVPYVIISNYIYPSLILVQSRKTRPCLTERLLMGRKESNQTNKQ